MSPQQLDYLTQMLDISGGVNEIKSNYPSVPLNKMLFQVMVCLKLS